ncbi:hypothetical protein [Spongiivirga citrea]|uniref:DNA primase n=1 Tax=Spongiivirga citrea TaxID=1481457 RepID=A0A6M0CGA2_9FLAO|nr:hypothetical protein [Spongiivirga citrea]NER16462.1 hypothetical protein [Spongiivirga citrea]
MQRKIVDYKKLTPDILSMLVEKYPYGYDDGHVISFNNHKNETIEAVEVRTEDTIYLVKVSTTLAKHMANFDADDYDDKDMNNPDAVIPLPEEAPEE